VRLINGIRKILPGTGRVIKNTIPDALAIAGAFLIWKGVDRINVPAGLIAAGILTIGAAVIWSKGADAK